MNSDPQYKRLPVVVVALSTFLLIKIVPSGIVNQHWTLQFFQPSHFTPYWNIPLVLNFLFSPIFMHTFSDHNIWMNEMVIVKLTLEAQRFIDYYW